MCSSDLVVLVVVVVVVAVDVVVLVDVVVMHVVDIVVDNVVDNVVVAADETAAGELEKIAALAPEMKVLLRLRAVKSTPKCRCALLARPPSGSAHAQSG